MQLAELVQELSSRFPDIAHYNIAVGDERSFKQTGPRRISIFPILRIETDLADDECCLFIEYSDDDELDPAALWTVAGFLERIGEIAKEHPRISVVASVEMDLEVEDRTFSRFDMPIIGTAGFGSPPLAVLVSSGFDVLDPSEPKINA